MKRILESMRTILESWGITTPAPEGRGVRSRIRLVLREPGGQRVPVGDLMVDNGEFVFEYLPEYVASGADPLRPFPSFNRSYRSAVLWPFFSTRVPSLKRQDVLEQLLRHEVDSGDTLRVLAVLGKRVITNPYEIVSVDAA